MSNNNNSGIIPMTGGQPVDSLMRSLSDIVGDLWGTKGANDPAAGTADGPAAAKPAAARSETKVPALPPFEKMWQLADETVDWTDVLVSTRPAEGMSERLWLFLRTQADAVLRGDPEAYAEVLRTANPLSDLQPYAESITAEIASADKLRADFACPDPMPADRRRYLSGMALRIARDLFALLPVREVTVRGIQAGEPALEVTFPREGLKKVAFAFADPAELVENCGGKIV